MTLATYVQFAFALAFVLALIGGAALIARRFGLGSGIGMRAVGSKRRLGIVEILPLDGRRKLVLLRRDGTEHLVILGNAAETVVEHGVSLSEPSFADVLEQSDAPPSPRMPVTPEWAQAIRSIWPVGGAACEAV